MQRPRKPSLFEAPIWKSLPYSLWAALLDDVDEESSDDDDSESSLFSSRVSSEGCLSDTESESRTCGAGPRWAPLRFLHCNRCPFSFSFTFRSFTITRTHGRTNTACSSSASISLSRSLRFPSMPSCHSRAVMRRGGMPVFTPCGLSLDALVHSRPSRPCCLFGQAVGASGSRHRDLLSGACGSALEAPVEQKISRGARERRKTGFVRSNLLPCLWAAALFRGTHSVVEVSVLLLVFRLAPSARPLS